MAEAWSNWSVYLQQLRRMRSHVNAWICNDYEDCVYIRVDGFVQVDRAAQYGVVVQVGHGGGNNLGGQWNDDGRGVAQIGATIGGCGRTYGPFYKRGGAYNVTCWCKAWGTVVNGYGAWPGPAMEAFATVTVPAIGYKAPRPPRNVSCRRNSDSQAVVTWQGDYTDSNGQYPWSNVYVERSADGGGWVQVAKLNWNAVNYTDNSLSQNHRYQYRVRSGNSAGYSGYVGTGTIYTTPARPGSVGLSQVGGTRVRISVNGASGYATGHKYQLSVNGGGWSSERDVPSLTFDTDAGSGTVRARVRAYRDGMYSGYTESGTITTIVPPNAPSMSDMRPVVVVPDNVTVSWSISHPDGSAQSAAQVEVTRDGSVTTHDVSGGSKSYSLRIDRTGDYRVRVRTKGVHASWGAWSGYKAFHAEVQPTLAITSPSIDGVDVSAMPVRIDWDVSSASGVSSQTFRLLSSGGAVLFSRDIATSARSFTLSADAYLPENSSTYTVEVVITDGYSVRASAQRVFDTDYAEPAMASVTLSYDRESMACHVSVVYGLPSWAVEGDYLVSPDRVGYEDYIPVYSGFSELPGNGVAKLGEVAQTVDVSVVRQLEDGTQEVIADSLQDGFTAIDRLPPLNIGYKYLVTSYSAAGTATTVEVHAFMDSDGAELFNFGVDAARAIRLVFDADSSSSYALGGEMFRFALGPDTPSLPTFYQDGTADATGRKSYEVLTAEEYRLIDRLRRDPRNAVCWYRDYWGGRHRVRASFALDYAAGSYGRWGVSADLTEVVWEGPRNG